MTKRIITQVRESIFEVFGGRIPGNTKVEKMALIRRATYTGKADPGGWAPTAAVVIHTESGIPNPAHECGGGWPITEGWTKVTESLSDHYCETHNGAVMTVFLI